MCFIVPRIELQKKIAQKPIEVYKVVPSKNYTGDPSVFTSLRGYKYVVGEVQPKISLNPTKDNNSFWKIEKGYYSFTQSKEEFIQRLAHHQDHVVGVFEIPEGSEYYESPISDLAFKINRSIRKTDSRLKVIVREVVSSSLIFKGYYDGSITPNGK